MNIWNTQQGGPDRRWILALLATTMVAVALIYFEAPQGELVYDDPDIIGFDCNDSIAEFSPSGACSYRPIRHLSLAVEGSLFGEPAAFARHVTNLLLHWLNAILVGLVGWWFFTKNRRVLALLLALTFAAHPVNVDSVAYISGRRDLLCALFILSGIWTFSLVRRTESSGTRLALGIATVVCFFGAIGSKELGVALPGVLLMLDYLDFETSDAEKTVGRAKAWLIHRKWLVLSALSVAGAYVFYRGIYDPVSFIADAGAWWGGTWWTNLLTSIGMQGYFAEVILAPVRLPGDWSEPMATPVESLASLRLWLGLGFLSLLGASAYWLLQRKRLEGVIGALWYVITVLPMSHIIPHHELFAEHYAYLPAIGVLLVLLAVLDDLLGRVDTESTRRIVAATLAASVLIFYGVRAHLHVSDYRNDLTLANATLQWSPDSGQALIRGATWLSEHERMDTARGYYQAAIERNVLPKFDEIAHVELALMALSDGDFDRASQLARHGLERHPRASTLKGVLEYVRCQNGETPACKSLVTLTRDQHDEKLRADVVYLAATVAWQMGSRQIAVDLATEAVRKQPENELFTQTRSKMMEALE